MSKGTQQKTIISNTAYTIGGSLLMNGVLQIMVYPLLYRYMGGEQLGTLLYIMGLVAILCPSVGQALNTSRLVIRRDHLVTNGDYNFLLLIFGGIGSVVALFVCFYTKSLNSAGGAIMTLLLFMITIFRYYGDVEYRLNLNYRRYFLYYTVLTVGYVLGYALYLPTGNWFFIFLTGELLALSYLALTGEIFHGFFQRSSFFSLAFSRGGFLVFSYLITNLTLNMDRVILKNMVGATAVTQYYATSLIGKTLVMLTAPVNIIIISYLTRSKERINKKQYFSFIGCGTGVALAFFCCTQIATPIFLKLFYGDLYDSVRQIITVVNLSQVLGLLSAYLFIVVLTFTEERWQLILQLLHLVVMSVLVWIFTKRSGLVGFSYAVLWANLIRVGAVICLGICKVGKPKEGVK